MDDSSIPNTISNSDSDEDLIPGSRLLPNYHISIRLMPPTEEK